MDRKYLEEHLSAYLDHELDEKTMREFAEKLKQYPDLEAELSRLQQLNRLARDAEVPMPAEGYFDGLAQRIEARIEREMPRERGKIVEFLLARRRAVAIISSVAAMILIVVTGALFYGPEKEMYPRQIQRTIDVTPGETKDQAPAPQAPVIDESEGTRKAQPPVRAYGDTVVIRGGREAEKAVVVDKSDEAKSPEQPKQEAIPDAVQEVAPATTPAPPATVESKEIKIVPTERQIEPVKPLGIDLAKPESSSVVVLKRQAEDIKAEYGNALQSVLADESSDVVWPESDPDSLEELVEGLIEADNWTRLAAIPAAIRAEAERDMAAYQRNKVQTEAKSLQSPATALSGDTGIEYRQAVRAFELARNSSFTRLSCVFARVLISHYLSRGEIEDRELWEARLDSVRTAERRYR